MKKLPMPFNDGEQTVSTLNGDDSDKGMQQEENKKITVKEDIDKTMGGIKSFGAEMKAKEAPFEDQFIILSRPFQYLLKVSARDKKSKFDRLNGLLKKNIINSIWAIGIAEEIQHIIICEIKHKKPASHIRDDIIVSSTKYMAQIFEQILNLFETDDYAMKNDIEVLFDLLIENVYRLENTITPTFYDSVRFDDTKKILRKYKKWVIERRSEFFVVA